MIEFAAQFPNTESVSDLIDAFTMMARIGGSYYMCQSEDMKDVADLIEDLPLTITERLQFCMAPANLRHPLFKRIFYNYIKDYSEMKEVKLAVYLPKYAPKSSLGL